MVTIDKRIKLIDSIETYASRNDTQKEEHKGSNIIKQYKND